MSPNTLTPPHNPHSPYYIHPQEDPSQPLVTTLLNGNNYYTWSRLMTLALKSKNKFQFIDASVPQPDETSDLYSSWERCNALVLSWVLNSVSPEIARTIIWSDTAVKAWNDLQVVYARSDVFRAVELEDEISKFRQGNLTVSEYFSRVMMMWGELMSLRKIPECVCDCGEKMRGFVNEDRVVRFLMGLNPSYETIRSQILMIQPLPPMNKVFSMVSGYERLKNPRN